MIDAHLELAREMLPAALDWHRDGPPACRSRATSWPRELGIEPGPELGELLAELGRRVFAGEVSDRDEAVARPRALDDAASDRLRARWPMPTASSAGSSPARCRARSSTPTSTPSRSWTSTRRPGATRWSSRATHSADLIEISDEDLERHDTSPRAGWPRGWRRRSSRTASTSSTACRPAAWQTVFHFHVHVIPRYEDDPLKLPWIPRGADADEIAADRRRDPRARADERAVDPLRARRRRRVDRALEPAAQPVHRRRVRRARWTCVAEVEDSDARAAGLARRGRHLHRRRRRQRLPADRRRRRRRGERASPAADRRRAPARGARDPDARALPRALPHRRAGGRARLRHDLGRRVGEVRARRGGRRADARRRRHAADGRARRARRGRASS